MEFQLSYFKSWKMMLWKCFTQYASKFGKLGSGHRTGQGPSSQGYGFSHGHVWMWELDYEESWAPKNWCFWTVVVEKTLESPLDSKEINSVNPKGNQPWIFIGRTDAEAPIIWPPDLKSWLMGKDPDTGKDWRQKEKGQQRMRWLDGITGSTDLNLSKVQ